MCLRPNPQARLRLFCFPYAGGGASIFHTWSASLPQEIALYPVQLPGRENRLRERPFTHLTPLIQTLAQVIQPYLNRPFAFWGHSLGALISFELARQLRRQNDPLPDYLLVSGYRAPHKPPLHSPIHQLPDAEFVEELRRFNGTPEAVLGNAELLQLFLPLLRADFAASETYIYTAEPPLRCPISAFGGLKDAEVDQDSLVAWREQTCSTFTLHMFPGDHFFLHDARLPLLRVVSQCLQPLLVKGKDSQKLESASITR